MRGNRLVTQLNVEMTGSIGETTPLFKMPMADLKEITIEMKGVTQINSIGVKQWILWTLKLHKDCMVKMLNCPFVIANQASLVVGFTTQNMTIESFRMPYACEECSHEVEQLARRGIEFQYPANGNPKWIRLPQGLECPKCHKGKLEADFFLEKVFKFLG